MIDLKMADVMVRFSKIYLMNFFLEAFPVLISQTFLLDLPGTCSWKGVNEVNRLGCFVVCDSIFAKTNNLLLISCLPLF